MRGLSVFLVATFAFLVLCVAAIAMGAMNVNELKPILALFAFAVLMLLLVVATSAAIRLRNRTQRDYQRYELVLSQSDEATPDSVATAYERLIQMVRVGELSRFSSGQPYVALELWHTPGMNDTGITRLMLLCERETATPALEILRGAYPNLSLRRKNGKILEFGGLNFSPSHVLRVRKARDYTAPIVSPTNPTESDARSSIAAVVRQQQQLGRQSCIRWCLLPASSAIDQQTIRRIERRSDGNGMGPGKPTTNAASSADAQQAIEISGGAMAYLELQAAVSQQAGSPKENYVDGFEACRRIISPLLSRQAHNTLEHRYMIVRQRLYQRRWKSAEPPWFPDLTQRTLVSPRELASVMELPSMAAEHSLPFERSTVPQLPAPIGLPRAVISILPCPNNTTDDENQVHEFTDSDEVLDAVVVEESSLFE